MSDTDVLPLREIWNEDMLEPADNNEPRGLDNPTPFLWGWSWTGNPLIIQDRRH